MLALEKLLPSIGVLIVLYERHWHMSGTGTTKWHVKVGALDVQKANSRRLDAMQLSFKRVGF